ncbi:hypothetical protein C8J56DRAFT_797491 [Mycena floridula]|nr:hypothetical protein C8J56DRAFT_797491 [Mycena floridula]
MPFSLNQVRASNLFDFRGVVAVVTGGGSGIGLMISSALVANGATVYIVGPKQAELDRISKIYTDAAGDNEGKMYGIEADIRSKSEAKRIAEEIGAREKYVTVLFNNAGVLQGKFKKPESGATASEYVARFFDDISQEDFDNTLKTNAVGPYWLTFAFLPLLEKWNKSEESHTQKFAAGVIMTSSMNGWTKDSMTSGKSYPYLFSKSALGHATASLAHELLPLGIRVNGIAPGLFPTDMAIPGATDENGVTHVPEGFAPEFEVPAKLTTDGARRDMAGLALFLVANGYVNGETVLIDGGTLLKHPSSY